MIDSDSFMSTRTISPSVTGGRCFESSWTAFIISLVDTIMFPFWKRCFLVFRNSDYSFGAPSASVKTPTRFLLSSRDPLRAVGSRASDTANNSNAI